MITKREVHQGADGFVLETAEPYKFEDELREAKFKYSAFPRGFIHDSSALAPLVVASVPLIFAIAIIYAMVKSGTHPLAWVILGACIAIIAVCALISARRSSRNKKQFLANHSDLFAANDHLFSISWIDDKEKYGASGKGILRINAIRLEECCVYHNAKENMIWIIPAHPGALRDIWRRGKTWKQRRDVCAKLLKTGRVDTAGDTDPFVGTWDVYRPFFEDLGLHIEETIKPVDFLAGTACFSAPDA